jgi:hypothetical protein
MAGSRIDYLRAALWLCGENDSSLCEAYGCEVTLGQRSLSDRSLLCFPPCPHCWSGAQGGRGNVITSERDPAVRVHLPSIAEGQHHGVPALAKRLTAV